MLLTTYSLINLKRRLYLWLLWLCCAFIPALQSCTESVSDTGDYSEAFKPVYDTVNLYFNLSKQPVKAIHYLDKAFIKIKHPYSNDVFSYYSFHFLLSKDIEHNYKKTLAYADSMLITAKKSVTHKQYLSNYTQANFAAGDAYYKFRQYDDAYKCYYQGYHTRPNDINDALLAKYTYRMGMVMYKQGRYPEAANYFKISYKQSNAYKAGFISFYKRQELLDNIGKSYENNGDTDSAGIYFKKTLEYINVNNGKYGHLPNALEVARGVVYGNQGNMAFKAHDYAQAEQLLKKSIAINLKPGNDNRDAQYTEIRLSRLYLKMGRLNELHALLQGLRVQLDTLKNTNANIHWYELVSSYYLQKKDYVKTLYFYKTYSSLKNLTVNSATPPKHNDMVRQQAGIEKEGQIENLKDHNKTQLIYLYLSVLFSIMSVIIIFLVFRNLKRSKQDIVAIQFLNSHINGQKYNLEKTLDEVNQASREKDRILRAVAHDLRNPLGGIAALSGIMITDVHDPEQTVLINLIKETSFNSLELINEILEATVSESIKLNKKWVEINSLISNSVELLRFKAAEKNQRIILHLLKTPMELYINREKIWRVVSNLISNAIKFSHNGAVIDVSASYENSEVVIAVKDNGIGIPGNMQQQVFNMFTDAKRPGTSGEKSFGLGLSICRQIIENHQGKIWLQSDVEYGSTFYVCLPANIAEAV